MDLSMISSIASLVLAVVAIWLSLHHKRDADIVNKDTRDLLADIRADSKVLANYAAPELEKYGNAMREYMKASGAPRQHDANSTPLPRRTDEPFHCEDLIALIKATQEKLGLVTPVQLIMSTEERISATELLALLLSAHKKGLVEWDRQSDRPAGDEAIRLTKIA